MSLRLLVVEDDYWDAQWLVENLTEQLDARVEVLTSERDFVRCLDGLATDPPDMIILDVMLRWSPPSSELTPEDVPTEVQEGGFFTAGLRCVERLRATEQTRRIPVLVVYRIAGE